MREGAWRADTRERSFVEDSSHDLFMLRLLSLLSFLSR